MERGRAESSMCEGVEETNSKRDTAKCARAIWRRIESHVVGGLVGDGCLVGCAWNDGNRTQELSNRSLSTTFGEG